MLCQCTNNGAQGIHLLRATCPPASPEPELRLPPPNTLPADTPQLTQEQMETFQRNLEALIVGAPLVNQASTSTSAVVASPARAERRSMPRVKVYAGGYFMTFDKVACNKMSHFWRCELKNSCSARIHTDPNRQRVINTIHNHNHPPVSEAELRAYGLNPANLRESHVYVVDNTIDTSLRRRIRKNQERLRAESLSSLGLNLPSTSAAGPSSTASSPAPLNFTHNHLLAALQASSSALPVVKAEPNNLQNVWNEAPHVWPKNADTPTRSLKMFIARIDGDSVYMPVNMEERSDECWKNAMEQFVGTPMAGSLVLEVNPRVLIYVNHQTIENWENDQLFLLDVSNASQWKIKFIERDFASV